MKIPNKIKIFVWTAYNDGLPTLQNLRKKQIVNEDFCYFYKATVEDTSHKLAQCPTIRECFEKYVPIVKHLVMVMSFTEMIMIVNDKGGHNELIMLTL